jgi:hypothetical protein
MQTIGTRPWPPTHEFVSATTSAQTDPNTTIFISKAGPFEFEKEGRGMGFGYFKATKWLKPLKPKSSFLGLGVQMQFDGFSTTRLGITQEILKRLKRELHKA